MTKGALQQSRAACTLATCCTLASWGQAGARPAEHVDAPSLCRYRGANSYHNSNRLTFLRVPAWRALLVHPGGVAPYLRLGEWPHEHDSLNPKCACTCSRSIPQEAFVY